MKQISTLTGLIENGRIYLIDIDLWLFLECDVETDTYRIFADIKPRDHEGHCWINKIIRMENGYYCILRNSKRVIFVDNSGNVTFFGDDNPFYPNNRFINSDAHIVGNMLVMLPGTADGCITLFDLEKKDYVRDYYLSQLIELKQEHRNQRIVRYTWVDNDRLLFCINGTDLVYTLDLSKLIIETINVNPDIYYSVRPGYGDFNYLLSKNSPKISVIDNSMHTIEEHDLSDAVDSGTGYRFCNEIEDRLYAIPASVDRIDTISGNTVSSILFPEEYQTLESLRNSKERASGVLTDGSKLFVLPFSSNGILEFDADSNEMTLHSIRISDDDFVRIRFHRTNILEETHGINLSSYMEYIRTGNGL